MKLALLGEYGIDYHEGLSRCMNDENLYGHLLEMFLSDDSYNKAMTAYEFSDYEALFRCLHELKGACGTASLKELYESVCPLVDQLRGYQGDGSDLRQQLMRLDTAYRRARDGIALALGL